MALAGVDIRCFRSADTEGVSRLWQDVFGPAKAWNRASDVIARKATVQAELFFVATHDDDIVGTVIAGFDGVRGWVHRLAVATDYRRYGIATRLMRRAESELVKLGCPKLNLQVRSDNADVVAFYAALGYRVEERISLGKPL